VVSDCPRPRAKTKIFPIFAHIGNEDGRKKLVDESKKIFDELEKE
jgi:hypothetical protein